MADAIVSAVSERLISLIEEQARYHINLVTGAQEEVRRLADELRTVRDVLDDAENRWFKENSVKNWLARLEQTSYEMEDVLDEWSYAIFKIKMETDRPHAAVVKKKVWSFIPSSPCLCFKKVAVRHHIAQKVLDVKEQLDFVLGEKDRYNFVLSQPTTDPLPNSWRVQSTSLIDFKKVQGRDIDSEILVSKLNANRGSQEELGFHILSIVGVGGLGKTTLAQLVYNDSRVEKSFDLRIWICVSDPFDVAAIAKGILESINGSSPNTGQLDVLLRNVSESISGKKFLLVLDDVWTEDHNRWETLKISLSRCGRAGSMILVTTRKERVAKIMGTMDDDIYHLGLLSNEGCWLLMRQIALSGGNPAVGFEEIGKKIAEKCKGLPLAAKTLGTLLCFKKTLEEWKNVLNSEIWKLENAEVDLFPHLLLSYNELSPTLKRCFSYCAVFPKDYLIDVEHLIGLWMALGYLGSKGDMEGRGRECFDILAAHSLFQDFEKDDFDEKIIKCKMHDIVHDFALFLRKSGRVEGARMNKITCQESDCSLLVSPHANEYCSLLWDDEESPLNLCHCVNRLRVLDMECSLESVPEGISNLIHLRWLSLFSKNTSYEELKIIFLLYSLQTLLLPNQTLEEIPSEIGNLIHLRHLELTSNDSLMRLPREIGKLVHLRHLALSCNSSLKELPGEVGNLIELRYLDVRQCSSLEELPREIGNLIELRYLDLSLCYSLEELPREIGNLIELRYLNLFHCSSLEELPREIGNLIELRYLNLFHCSSLEELPREIGNLIELRYLSLRYCSSLEELPREIGNLIHLRDLDLSSNESLKALPESIHNLHELQTLDVDESETLCKNMPEGLNRLTNLHKLRGLYGGCGWSKLGLLKDLNNLSGHLELHIRLADDGLEQVVGDAREAELRNKVHIETLGMEFEDEMDENEESSSLWMDVIDALEPHPTLQRLYIGKYQGSTLPLSWMVSPFNQVRIVYLNDCNHLLSLPPLGKLPCLEELYLHGMEALQFVGPEFLGITRGGGARDMDINEPSTSVAMPTNIVAFPKLKLLIFRNCPYWREWEDITAEEEEDFVAVSLMPCLTKLEITCGGLTELPHRLLRKALSLQVLDIEGSTGLEQCYKHKDGSSWTIDSDPAQLFS